MAPRDYENPSERAEHGGIVRRLVIAGVVLAISAIGLEAWSGPAARLRAPIAILSVMAAVPVALWFASRRGVTSVDLSGGWEAERAAAAAEVACEESRDALTIAPEAARIVRGDYPQLDAALGMYQAARGRGVYPRFERLPRSMYGDSTDACVRRGKDDSYIGFTPAMLETFNAPMLLAVIAHLMARAQHLDDADAPISDSVVEADRATLLLTRDHVALLRALEAARTGPSPLAFPGDGEAWFSEDEAVPRGVDEHGRVEGWKRVDRLAKLRAELGALSLDAKEAPAEVRLARIFDVDSGELTPVARDALREG
jgi:hypothetical protein